MAVQLPKRGFVFWPVGTGDSTTVLVKEDEIVIQIDLHQADVSKNGGDTHSAVVDELAQVLPMRNGKPYLSVFVLTHPDEDHIRGFAELLKEVTIGEIWDTPRIFAEYKKDLCDDAKKFKEEVVRRTRVMIETQGQVGAGDRLRIIGHDDLFERGDYARFPDNWRSYPGDLIRSVEGREMPDLFEAFVHAPFKDDSAAERNNSSLSLLFTLKDGSNTAKAFFFGDREYPTIKKIFDKTKENHREEYLEWDVMLASHHCSKNVMYWHDPDDSDEVFRKDLMEDFEEYKRQGAYLVSSCESDFSDESGKNPPHMKARKRYEEIVDSGHFICTHEHPNEKEPLPVMFELTSKGFSYVGSAAEESAASSALSTAVGTARGDAEPPLNKVGFGQSCD